MNDDAVVVSDLTKYFGELSAVNHIGFEVKEGEFFGFLGPNGAGKTTTIRMLTGVLKPDEGTAAIMGYDIRTEGLRARQVMGIVPEMANAYVDLSAWQNLMFLAELYGVPKGQRTIRARELLERVGLYQRRNQLVKGFSKGMKQKLLVCMALVSGPDILFLDEPTAGLDVQSARMIRDMLMELNHEGTTVFLTTHNMEEANQLCEKIAIINEGTIVAIDRPEELRGKLEELKSIEVSFSKTVNPQMLLSFSKAGKAVRTGDRIRLFTDDPGDLLCDLVDYARSEGMKIVSLNMLAPSLEDVFVKLTENSGKVD